MIDFTITEDEQLLQDTAARFGNDHLLENERAHEKASAFPDTVHALFEEMGLTGLNIPDSGMEVDHRIAVWKALAQADPSAPFGLDPVGPGGAALPFVPDGKGAIVTAEGIQRNNNILTGTIAWVPRDHVDWVAIIDADGLWLVNAPKTSPMPGRPCGLQACGALSIEFEDTPAEQIGGPDVATAVLAECRILAATVLLGAARDAHTAAAQYAQERIAFGKPIAHHQGLAFQLADAATELLAAELLISAAAGDPIRTANAHAHAADVAFRVCERSVQALGGHGYLYDHRIEKRMRDVRAVASLYGGSIGSELDAATHILQLSDPMGLNA